MDGIVKEMEDAKERKKGLNFMLDKRQATMEYLKKIYTPQNKHHWLGVSLVEPEEILKHIEETSREKRFSLLYRSISLGRRCGSFLV